MSEPPIPGMFSSEDTKDTGGAFLFAISIAAGLLAAAVLGIVAVMFGQPTA